MTRAQRWEPALQLLPEMRGSTAVRHPLATTDYSSFMLQAQSSGAKVVGFALGRKGLCNKETCERSCSRCRFVRGLALLELRANTNAARHARPSRLSLRTAPGSH